MFPRIFEALVFISVLGIAVQGWAGDTTYSRTRSVPVTPENSTLPVSVHPMAIGETFPTPKILVGNQEDQVRQSFFHSCMVPGEFQNLAALGGYFVTLPFRLGFCYVFDNFRASHVDLFQGKPKMETLPDRSWRFGWGFGFGGLYMPQTAGGMPFTLHAEALHSPSPRHQWRLRVSSFGSLLGTSTDYERTVLVDGNPIGIQSDHLTGYSQSGFPFLAENLWTNANGLYLSTGAGAVSLHESMHYTQMSTFGSGETARFQERRSLYPMISLCIGRFASRSGGTKYHRFELRYQAMLLFPHNQSSFPTDNVSSSHSLTWDWGWLW